MQSVFGYTVPLHGWTVVVVVEWSSPGGCCQLLPEAKGLPDLTTFGANALFLSFFVFKELKMDTNLFQVFVEVLLLPFDHILAVREDTSGLLPTHYNSLHKSCRMVIMGVARGGQGTPVFF